ncbi:VIT1/CCC1 transporter family protein [Roseivirga sp. BDSF3-8]|uniref:VIT1/CCC1 transporter family protein n=1 Tax=Roseivirga sp. BDSF3-8 TaxID=3241598 RepID=UPI00353279AC
MQKIEDKLHTGKKLFLFDRAYISEFVYGGIDGAITTFAVVAGAAGANADLKWVLIFGFANLIADGFSMSVGNFLSVKAEHEDYDKHREIEYWEIENLREKEIEEIREIYAAKGFKGELLEQVVEVITSNDDVWVDTMMKEELEMAKDDKAPIQTATATFLSFIAIGLIPLLSYLAAIIFDLGKGNLFLYSCIATGIGLIVVGNLKAVATRTNRFRAIAETLSLGGIAAFLAYFVGEVLQRYLL